VFQSVNLKCGAGAEQRFKSFKPFSAPVKAGKVL